jgi:hypothetical protein
MPVPAKLGEDSGDDGCGLFVEIQAVQPLTERGLAGVGVRPEVDDAVSPAKTSAHISTERQNAAQKRSPRTMARSYNGRTRATASP